MNYNIIKPGDMVFTTSLEPLGCGIRVKEAGIKNIFNTKISTHVGIVVELNSHSARMLVIAEMLNKLEINPFSDYSNNGYFGKRIVDIKYLPEFQDLYNNLVLQRQVLDWWEKGKKYDWSGMLKHLFPFLKDKEKNFYCSEMIGWLILDITNKGILSKPTDNITPWDLQKSDRLISRKGWK
jgi:hypothetical protein